MFFIHDVVLSWSIEHNLFVWGWAASPIRSSTGSTVFPMLVASNYILSRTAARLPSSSASESWRLVQGMRPSIEAATLRCSSGVSWKM